LCYFSSSSLLELVFSQLNYLGGQEEDENKSERAKIERRMGWKMKTREDEMMKKRRKVQQ